MTDTTPQTLEQVQAEIAELKAQQQEQVKMDVALRELEALKSGAVSTPDTSSFTRQSEIKQAAIRQGVCGVAHFIGGPLASWYYSIKTGNMIPSLVGTGVAVVGAAGALASAAGVEGGVAAADFWNPVGWGAALGAAATGVGALIAGIFQGGQEQAEKQKEALEKTEATYAGKADQLREQYQFIRTFMTELGTPNSVIGQLNNEMITKLQNPNITGAMSNQDFQNTFTNYLNKFSLSNFNYSGGQMTTQPQQLQKVLSEQYNSHMSVLNGLVNELNKGGATLTAPASNLYDAQTFTETYNSILNKEYCIKNNLHFSLISYNTSKRKLLKSIIGYYSYNML